MRSNAAGAGIQRKRRKPAAPASVEVQTESHCAPPRANRGATRHPAYGYRELRTHRPSANPHRPDLPRRSESRGRNVDPGMRTLQPPARTRAEPGRCSKHPAETPNDVPTRSPGRKRTEPRPPTRGVRRNRNGRISQAASRFRAPGLLPAGRRPVPGRPVARPVPSCAADWALAGKKQPGASQCRKSGTTRPMRDQKAGNP